MRHLPGNAQHIGARQEQQDAFAFSDPSNKDFLSHGGLLAVVSDGMGGLSNGQQASMSAVRTFLAEYEKKQRNESIPAALHRGLQGAFDVVHQINQGGGQSGATLVAAAARDRELYWVSVGDSRLYLVRRGKLVQLNRDHSYRERLFDQVAHEQIRLDDAVTHPEREHLTSYLGMPAGSPEVDANLKPLILEPDDCVFLCTDGVYRSLSEKELAAAFEGANASRACEAIKAAVLARATQQQDNLTIVAFRCEESGAGAMVAKRGMRTKVAFTAACLMVCANLLAAGMAFKNVRALNANGKKDLGAPANHDRRNQKPSPLDSKKSEPTGGQPVGEDATVNTPEEQGTGGADATDSKPAGKDTAAPQPGQKKDGGKRNERNNRRKPNPPADTSTVRERTGETQEKNVPADHR